MNDIRDMAGSWAEEMTEMKKKMNTLDWIWINAPKILAVACYVLSSVRLFLFHSFRYGKDKNKNENGKHFTFATISHSLLFSAISHS